VESFAHHFEYLCILEMLVGLDFLDNVFGLWERERLHPAGVEHERHEHAAAVGLAVEHRLKVFEWLGIEDEDGERRGGGVPVLDGHGGEVDELHHAVDVAQPYYQLMECRQCVDATHDMLKLLFVGLVAVFASYLHAGNSQNKQKHRAQNGNWYFFF